MEDFTQGKDIWRIFRIISEFVDGVDTLSDVEPAVAIFGSARIQPDHKYYKLTVELSKKLTEKGYSIITGAGGGVMEAGNKGAHEADGNSIGLNIQLPFEQEVNEYVNTLVDFRYFFIRKVMFIKYSSAIVLVPGGFGTLDEFFETLTLVQTKRANSRPIYLLGSQYWEGLLKWMKEAVLSEKYINEMDLNLFTVTDNIDEIVEGIHNSLKEIYKTKLIK